MTWVSHIGVRRARIVPGVGEHLFHGSSDIGNRLKGSTMSKLNFSSPWSFWIGKSALLLAALVLVAGSTGCNAVRTLDEAAALTYRDFVWAKRAYNLRYGSCDRPYEEHFQNGFCAGYADVAGGGDGYVPALPPDDYRSYEFQSADGAKCVNAWFEGYPAGVAAAKQDRTGEYHDVMISRMIDRAVKQDKTEAKLPKDISVVNGQSSQEESAYLIQPNQPLPISPIQSDMSPNGIVSPQPFSIPAMRNVVPASFRSSSAGSSPFQLDGILGR